MIHAVVVGYGLAGRVFHCPLIRRQPGMTLRGVVARDPETRAEVGRNWGVMGYAGLDVALADPAVDLIVLATPHDTHAALSVRALEAGKHCVVDKVMALTAAEADRMIAARDAAGRVLSVFHNRRWDWDFLTLQAALGRGDLGDPLRIEAAVWRFAAPRTWRGRLASAGTILHDWGAHLVDQALHLDLGPCRRLAAWITPAPWPGVDSGGHGTIVLEFDRTVFTADVSRIARAGRPRWTVLGTEATLIKHGLDPQEDALRAGDLDAAAEPPGHRAVRCAGGDIPAEGRPIETVRGSWDAYYANIAEHLAGRAPLAVTAEEGREVVRILEAAARSAAEHRVVEGPWGG